MFRSCRVCLCVPVSLFESIKGCGESGYTYVLRKHRSLSAWKYCLQHHAWAISLILCGWAEIWYCGFDGGSFGLKICSISSVYLHKPKSQEEFGEWSSDPRHQLFSHSNEAFTPPHTRPVSRSQSTTIVCSLDALKSLISVAFLLSREHLYLLTSFLPLGSESHPRLALEPL